MDKNLLILYYLIKRGFLFLDEWLFYYVLYILYTNEYYFVFILSIIYGGTCTYTSYANIEILENELSGLHQAIWLDRSPLSLIKSLINQLFI